MGREWYFNWGSKSSKKAARAGGGSGSEGAKSSTPAPSAAVATVAAASATEGGGCMNAVYQLFDLHHFQICLHPHPHHYDPQPRAQPTNAFLSHKYDEATSLKGEDAARNSLESSKEEAKPSSRRDTKLKVAIEVPRQEKQNDESCSEGARTPNLVARLMGLDILPDSSTSTTPRSSTTVRSSPHKVPSSTPPRSKNRARNDIHGPKSLLRSSKSSTHILERHRLSLELNKEDSILREMESSRPSCSAISTKRRELRMVSKANHLEEESRSPRYYAKQIMKQAKESVSRRRRSFGSDITNKINNGQRDDHQIRRDEHLLSTKPKKASNLKEYSSSTKVSILNSENNPSGLQYVKPKQEYRKLKSANKSCSPKSADVDSIRKKKEEQFIRPPTRATDKKSKNKAPHVLLVPLNKQSSPLSPTQLPHKQGASSQGRAPKVKMSTNLMAQLHFSIAEFEYISRILKCSGIEPDTPVCITTWTWFSSFTDHHALDPSVFQKLETTHYTPTSGDDNDQLWLSLNHRRMIFDLVDEALNDMILRGKVEPQQMMKGSELLQLLCKTIESLPCMDCQTLQDIDAFVEKDLPKLGACSSMIAFQEEGDAIVSKIEDEILDSLIQEIAVFCLGRHIISSSIERYVRIMRVLS